MTARFPGEPVAAMPDNPSSDMFTHLTSQEAQVACFRNVAAHLEPGGTFVIEVMVPELRRLPPGQHVVPFHTSPTRWAFGLMAQLAGMRLRERWDGWTREPFTSESTKHVSVWEKPGG